MPDARTVQPSAPYSQFTYIVYAGDKRFIRGQIIRDELLYVNWLLHERMHNILKSVKWIGMMNDEAKQQHE